MERISVEDCLYPVLGGGIVHWIYRVEDESAAGVEILREMRIKGKIRPVTRRRVTKERYGDGRGESKRVMKHLYRFMPCITILDVGPSGDSSI